MIFNSITYLVFLALVVGLYRVLPRRPRLWMLFLTSLAFYGFWSWAFLSIMMLSAVTDYLVSLRLGVTRDRRMRKVLLGVSLTINFGLLFFFKYLIFFTDTFVTAGSWLGLELHVPKWISQIILPLGISFYTFQTVSYTVDVYRRFFKPEKDFILYCTYVVFFPQLVAGPILRAREVIHQLSVRPPFRWLDLGEGIRRILYGLFLKTVLADNIAPLIEAGYATPAAMLSALDVWTLAFLFGLQIYFDFSAYSHIAIGSAKIMGIHFPENFDFPYLTSSPRDFWKRWHISLSSWIRDYLYLPLAGARVHDRSTGGLIITADRRTAQREHRPIHWTRALLLTWTIMGLWHGAAWTFVLWGLYHGLFVLAHRMIAPRVASWPVTLRQVGGWAITLPLAMLSWIFFRAEGPTQGARLMQALTFYAKILDPRQYARLNLRENVYLVTAGLTVAMIATYFIQTWLVPRLRRIGWLFFLLDTAVCCVLAWAAFVFLRPMVQFIYFQF